MALVTNSRTGREMKKQFSRSASSEEEEKEVEEEVEEELKETYPTVDRVGAGSLTRAKAAA